MDMRGIPLSAISVSLILGWGAAAPAWGGESLSAGVTIGSDGVESFHLAACTHYGFKTETVAVFHKHRIPDDHVPVVYYIAHRAEVSPDVVIGLRMGGKSWWEISAHFGLSAEVFYVPVARRPGPPYGKAWGHFKNGKRTNWAAVRLSDDDVVTLVNVRFLAAHHGCTPDEVIEMRQKGTGFVKLHVGFKLSKGNGPGKVHGNVHAGGGKAGVKVHSGGPGAKIKVHVKGHPGRGSAGKGRGGGKRK